jgi:hypothetical protein
VPYFYHSSANNLVSPVFPSSPHSCFKKVSSIHRMGVWQTFYVQRKFLCLWRGTITLHFFLTYLYKHYHKIHWNFSSKLLWLSASVLKVEQLVKNITPVTWKVLEGRLHLY